MKITIDGITKCYEEFTALDNICFNISKPTIHCIMGQSGSGKTTLMKIISGLLVPTKGKILYDDVDLYAQSFNNLASIRNKDIGFVFQDYFLEERFNVFENVAIPLYIRSGLNKKEIFDLVNIAVDKVGLMDKIEQIVSSLSGGEKQRVSIARAIVGNPKIIFADEPTGNLDTDNGEKIMSLFDTLSKEGKIVLLVTHNPILANKCEICYTLLNGKIIDERMHKNE